MKENMKPEEMENPFFDIWLGAIVSIGIFIMAVVMIAPTFLSLKISQVVAISVLLVIFLICKKLYEKMEPEMLEGHRKPIIKGFSIFFFWFVSFWLAIVCIIMEIEIIALAIKENVTISELILNSIGNIYFGFLFFILIVFLVKTGREKKPDLLIRIEDE